MKIPNRYTIRLVLFVCGGLPFFFSLDTSWARPALIGYAMTAGLFGVLLADEYPPVGTKWFWKAMTPIAVLHSALIFGLVSLNLTVPAMNKLPRMLYGFLGIIGVFEWWLSVRIIQACQPKNGSSARKPHDSFGGVVGQ